MRRAAVALLAAALAALACGGGGGGGGPTQPPLPSPGITFTPSSGGGGANSLGLAQGAGTTANTLVLELRANQVTDLYGVAFDLAYPEGLLTFSRFTEGPFLASAGDDTTVQVSGQTGSLVVGLSQLGMTAGVDGSGLLLTFEFTANGAGNGSFTFSDNQAFFPSGAPQAVAWQAGTVVVTR